LKRVQTALAELRGESAQTICDQLWQAVQAHNPEWLHQDDFTTVLVKRK
jgi:serine phosphatase RsbU (regulator of sigma subunit)